MDGAYWMILRLVSAILGTSSLALAKLENDPSTTCDSKVIDCAKIIETKNFFRTASVPDSAAKLMSSIAKFYEEGGSLEFNRLCGVFGEVMDCLGPERIHCLSSPELIQLGLPLAEASILAVVVKQYRFQCQIQKTVSTHFDCAMAAKKQARVAVCIGMLGNGLSTDCDLAQRFLECYSKSFVNFCGKLGAWIEAETVVRGFSLTLPHCTFNSITTLFGSQHEDEPEATGTELDPEELASATGYFAKHEPL